MKTDQTLAALAGANEERKKSLLQYVSEGANNADLEAAGYTPAEVAAAFPPVKEVVASKESDRDRQAAPKETPMLQQATPTLRDNFRENVRRGASALGADEQYAQFISGRIAGTGGDMGLIDVTGLGVIPGVQEGVQQAKRGYKTGSDTDIAMGALNAGLNVLGAIPGGKILAKGVVKGAEKLAAAYDPNVVRMFAGPEAKNFPHLMEAEASVRRKAGEDPQKIWEDTGIQFLPDGRPVFQIDPAGAKILDLDDFKQRIPEKSALNITNGGNGRIPTALSSFIDFPELLDNYPQLKGFRLVFDPTISAQGSMDVDNKIVRLNLDYLKNATEQELKETFLHELQHGIQAAERTPGGASPYYFFGKKKEWNPTTQEWERTGPYQTGAADMEPEVQNYQMLEDDLNASMLKYKTGLGEYKELQDAYKNASGPNSAVDSTNAASEALQFRELNEQYAEIIRKADVIKKENERLDDWAYRKYQENPGELEARAASLWSQLTPEERLKTPPLEIYNKAARTNRASYATLGETAVYGNNYMPTSKFPASQEEALARLDANAKMISPESVDQTTAALGTVPKAPNPSVDAKPKPQINPLFKPKEVQDDNLVTFYSPLKSAVDEMVIGSEGKSGRDVMAYLNKRAPNVSKSEIQFSRINLDPEKKYAKEEILNSLEYTTEGTVAKFRGKKSGALYGKEQLPKNYLDKQQDYFEVTLEAKDLPGRVYTHYNDKTLAHSRTTVHTDTSGEKYFIINELQSDALQSVGKKHVFAVPDPAERVGDLKSALSFDMNANYREPVFDFFTEEGMNPKFNREELVAAYKEKFGINVAGKDIATVHKDALRKAVDDLNEYDIDYFENKVDYILKDFQTYQIELKMSEAGYQSEDVPFESTSAYVRNLLFANIAKAKQEGVNKIVIPNIEEIARLRQDDFEGGLEAAKKALRPTYDNAVKKAVNMLNSEYGNSIKLGSRGVEYRDLTKKSGVRSSPSMELDITNFNFDPTTQKVRMAHGGLVGDADGGDAGKAIKNNPIWQHHMSNVEGGKAVKNKDGSVSTVRTMIMGDGQYEYLIPTVWGGKVLSDQDAWKRAMSSGVNWPKAPAGEEGVASLEHLDQQLHKNMTPTGFAQGGSVEDEQMNRLLQDGGMAGGGVAQEPVTGNEVPPGALPAEVRDNVPVQLSEGEYVVPADVLRFFGMRFFEDLRNQAKQGLAEMQSNGRIGGANVDSSGAPTQENDDQLSPEEEQMLNNALGSSTGMAEGGDVPFDRTTFTLDGSTSGRESRKYIDPTTGVTQDFQFYLGEPSSLIPSNFVPWTQALADAAAAPKVPTTPTTPGGTGNTEGNAEDRDRGTGGNTDGGTVGGGFSYDNWAEKNYVDITSNPYQFGIDALTDDTGKFASKALGAVGLLGAGTGFMLGSAAVKGGSKIQNIAEANAALQVMESQGLAGTDNYKNLQKTIGIAIDALPTLQQLLIEKEFAATGNGYTKAIEKMGKESTPAPAVKDPTIPVTVEEKATNTTTTPSVGYGSGKVDPGLAKAAAAAKPTLAPATNPKPSTAAATTKATSTLEKTKQGLKVGGFKEGGLVTRGTKTAHKTKGLAGKQ